MAHVITVFLSSTAKDLQPWRDAVADGIRMLKGFHCLRMEDFGAVDAEPAAVCRARVAECDVFVGLVGHLNGSCPEGSDLSYTQIEHEEAKRKRKARLLFVADDEFPLPARLGREPEDAYQRQLAFRAQVMRERTVVFFGDPQSLATQVVAALQTYQTRRTVGRGKKKPTGRPRAGEADRAKTERLYLEHLAERYQYLDFRGMGISDRVPLRLPLLDMYVPLKARVETPAGETWARQTRLAGRLVGDEEAVAMGERLSKPQPVLQLLEEKSGLILLGDPGSGKTTFLKSLALELSLGRAASPSLAGRLPVLVPLSAYANALARRDVPLGTFLSAYFKERGFELPLAPPFKHRLARGEILLLLDGLDEVREQQRRSLVVERVQDFYSRHRGAGNKFVLTSRVVGYREVRLSVEGLAEATLVDFDEEEIESFIGRWTSAIEKAASGETRVAREEAAREREELLAAVHGNPGVRSLASNPLLLTILALMKRQGVTLPERRVELYQRYVETLLKHWNLARGLGGRPSKDLDLLDTLRILQPLALWMHQTSPGVGLVKEGDLNRELERIFRERKDRDPERSARQFLEDVREHTSLLLDRGGRQYGFIHLTFQEYLAAAALAQRGQQEVGPIVDALASHVGDAAWQEVSLLTLGYLGLVQQRDQAAESVLADLLSRAPHPVGEAAILAGEALMDMGRGVVTVECRERVVEALLRVLRNDREVKPQRRATAGAVLAGIGDPRPEVMSVDGMELCWMPAGPFLMGSEDQQATDYEKPQFECTMPYGLWVGRYPVTVAQYGEYLADTRQPAENTRDQRPNEPVVRVSWRQAIEFCRWLTMRWRKAGRLGADWEVRLPTEAEWEKSARGGLVIPSKAVVSPENRVPEGLSEKINRSPGRRFPWGGKSDLNRGNFEKMVGDISAVGCFPRGASPYGCEDLSGNVWERTQTLWSRGDEQGIFTYPYVREDGREGLDSPKGSARILRGGSYLEVSMDVRCASRNGGNMEFQYINVGFRIVLSPFPL
jgi:formylglycine-generating enzyme required for sulfatase activity